MAKVTPLPRTEIENVLRAYSADKFYCEMLGPPNADLPKVPELWNRLQAYDAQDLRARAS
jgi:hypothetical protein